MLAPAGPGAPEPDPDSGPGRNRTNRNRKGKPAMRILLLVAATMLAACGVDGPPQPPAQTAPATGVTVSGEARAGIVIAP